MVDDVARHDQLADIGTSIDLGLTTCLATQTSSLRLATGVDPTPGAAQTFLVRDVAISHYGRSAQLDPRTTTTDCT